MTDTVMTLDIVAARQAAETIAREASPILLKYFEGDLHESHKVSAIDIVTEADRESEAFIVRALREQFPTHYILGEEGGGSEVAIEDAEYRWYVDPLDGTTNYANKLPIFSISLALTDAEMRPLVGVVYDPISDEMFSAALGHGATLNGRPLHVSAATTLESCVVGSGFPYDKHTNPDNNLKEWGAFLVRVRGMRRLGSAALDLCYVATGRLDGYWESGVKPWDILAGALCVMEAGGVVSNYAGQNSNQMYAQGRLVAANPVIHRLMVEVLSAP